MSNALARHIHENPDHQINNDAELVEYEGRYFHRKFKESLYIRKAESKMNDNDGMDLDAVWTSALLPFVKKP